MNLQTQGGHFLNAGEAEAVGKILVTAQRTLESGNCREDRQSLSPDLAGISIPDGTRCLLADCGGVGRDFPWSIEKLSPTLAFFVVDGLEQGANRCQEILQFGGMGHTAGMHTGSREAAIKYGVQMPASRVVINSPTTHGAIGFSTDLPPSMTLGCGSWGGNVTSDNVSPVHLLDIKRVAFETKPVNGPANIALKPSIKAEFPASGQKPRREQIAAIVDQFLSKKLGEDAHRPVEIRVSEPLPPLEPAVPAPQNDSPVRTVIHELRPQSLTDNGFDHTPVDFVSETDVREAIDKGKKIYITDKTILTPSARDLGEEKDIFARV